MGVLTGKKKVKSNIQKALTKFVFKSRKSALSVGREVRERGMRITPVNTGNLINSWYGPIIVKENPIVSEIGLTAEYAPDVHEKVYVKFRKPGAQAKFLENPLKEVEAEILKKIQKGIKI